MRARLRCCDMGGVRVGGSLRALAHFAALCLLSQALSVSPTVLAQDTGIVAAVSPPATPMVTSEGSLTCVTVPATAGGATWGMVCAGNTYTYTASGYCSRGGCGDCETDPDGKDPGGRLIGCSGGGGNPSAMFCPGAVCYSLVGKIDGGSCFQLGSSGTFTASDSGTLQLYFNDDYYGDNGGSFTFCIALSATATVTFVDAQGFGPQLDEYGNPWLQTPIANAVDSYNRVGALTDGASLIVVQLSTGVCSLAGWTVEVSDPDDDTLGAAQVGSLWGGDENNLPPLPSTIAEPGDTTITLQDGESAFFYVPPPSWAFDSDSKTHDIQIQVFDQNSNPVTTAPFTLHKPPLVLVHGWTGNPGNWANFPSVLSGAGIQVDTVTADYAVSNTCGIDAVFDAVPKAISNATDQLRVLGIAATRVDVVAHSYGGVLTRWYMTLSEQLPDGQDRGTGASPALAFRTTPIKGTRSADLEFLRADNFGIGDIRRFITLGVPHAGTSAAWKAVQLLNQWVTGKAYRNRELRNDTMSIENTLSTTGQDFRAIGLSEAGTPTECGMSIVDAAAFGTYPITGTCGPCPDISLALASLPAIPWNTFRSKGLPWATTRFGTHSYGLCRG